MPAMTSEGTIHPTPPTVALRGINASRAYIIVGVDDEDYRLPIPPEWIEDLYLAQLQTKVEARRAARPRIRRA